MARAYLLLEDGSIYPGRALGSQSIKGGEIVFHTGMTGYQEIITDPSYAGQIVVMTYPHIGGYGVNHEDVESYQPHLSGFVMGDYVEHFSNHRATRSLVSYLEENNIPAIDQVDTREITRKIREQGSMRALITTQEHPMEQLKQQLLDVPSMEGANWVQKVSSTDTYQWNINTDQQEVDIPDDAPTVVVIDCGVKRNILRHLTDLGMNVHVVPSTTNAEQIMMMRPDGIMVSNGPGDPSTVTDVVETISNLLGKVPLMGICMGHQLISLAMGAKTYKLKFGHHGANHPVKNVLQDKIEITSMNHGFAVDTESLQKCTTYGDVEITHVHLTDGTLEGFRVPESNIYAIQFHPEASPGPHDSNYLFKEFGQCIKTHTKKS